MSGEYDIVGRRCRHAERGDGTIRMVQPEKRLVFVCYDGEYRKWSWAKLDEIELLDGDA